MKSRTPSRASSVTVGSFPEERAAESGIALVVVDDREERLSELVEQRTLGVDAVECVIPRPADLLTEDRDEQVLFRRRAYRNSVPVPIPAARAISTVVVPSNPRSRKSFVAACRMRSHLSALLRSRRPATRRPSLVASSMTAAYRTARRASE